MSSNVPTPEALVQLGYNLGLHTVEEAYRALMGNHYVFFKTDNITAEISEFHNALVAHGIGRLLAARQMMVFDEMTVLEGARKLSYTLTDNVNSEENVNFVSLNLDDLSEEDLLMSSPKEQFRFPGEVDGEEDN